MPPSEDARAAHDESADAAMLPVVFHTQHAQKI